MTNILYISYDGLLEPLGQSQVLAYQKQLSKSQNVHIVSFEKSADLAKQDLHNKVVSEIADSGIAWYPLRYHKSPSALATIYDISVGLVVGLWLVLNKKIQLVHARSYVAGVIGLTLKKLTGVKFVFDMRGFWADERLDGGIWIGNSMLYRLAKWFEKQFLLNADHVISLTYAAIKEIERFPYLIGRMPPITVIPTCADLLNFRPEADIKKEFLLGYVGSAGTWYEFDATVTCFSILLQLKPDSRFLIINRTEHDYICDRLIAGGVPLSAVELRSCSFDEMPMQIARMCASIFFIKPVFSKQASAPTKLAELLGCGIPCLSNKGVGDMAEILESENVGVAVNDFSQDSLRIGLIKLLEMLQHNDITEKCVNTANKYFSLDHGVHNYEDVYLSLHESNNSF